MIMPFMKNLSAGYHESSFDIVTITIIMENIFMSRFISVACCALFVISMISADAKAAYDVVAGKKIYETTCAGCHKGGLLGAPKLSDKAAWVPRIKQGLDVLVSNAIKGFQGKTGTMPARGGNSQLTDAQVSDSVDYIVQQQSK